MVSIVSFIFHRTGSLVPIVLFCVVVVFGDAESASYAVAWLVELRRSWCSLAFGPELADLLSSPQQKEMEAADVFRSPLRRPSIRRVGGPAEDLRYPFDEVSCWTWLAPSVELH